MQEGGLSGAVAALFLLAIAGPSSAQTCSSNAGVGVDPGCIGGAAFSEFSTRVLLSPSVAEARNALAEKLDQIADQVEGGLMARNPDDRADLLAQVADLMDGALIPIRTALGSDRRAASYIEQGDEVIRCLNLASDEELPHQVAMIRAGAAFWRLDLDRAAASVLCD